MLFSGIMKNRRHYWNQSARQSFWCWLALTLTCILIYLCWNIWLEQQSNKQAQEFIVDFDVNTSTLPPTGETVELLWRLTNASNSTKRAFVNQLFKLDDTQQFYTYRSFFLKAIVSFDPDSKNRRALLKQLQKIKLKPDSISASLKAIWLDDLIPVNNSIFEKQHFEAIATILSKMQTTTDVEKLSSLATKLGSMHALLSTGQKEQAVYTITQAIIKTTDKKQLKILWDVIAEMAKTLPLDLALSTLDKVLIDYTKNFKKFGTNQQGEAFRKIIANLPKQGAFSATSKIVNKLYESDYPTQYYDLHSGLHHLVAMQSTSQNTTFAKDIVISIPQRLPMNSNRAYHLGSAVRIFIDALPETEALSIRKKVIADMRLVSKQDIPVYLIFACKIMGAALNPTDAEYVIRALITNPLNSHKRPGYSILSNTALKNFVATLPKDLAPDVATIILSAMEQHSTSLTEMDMSSLSTALSLMLKNLPATYALSADRLLILYIQQQFYWVNSLMPPLNNISQHLKVTDAEIVLNIIIEEIINPKHKNSLTKDYSLTIKTLLSKLPEQTTSPIIIRLSNNIRTDGQKKVIKVLLTILEQKDNPLPDYVSAIVSNNIVKAMEKTQHERFEEYTLVFLSNILDQLGSDLSVSDARIASKILSKKKRFMNVDILTKLTLVLGKLGALLSKDEAELIAHNLVSMMEARGRHFSGKNALANALGQLGDYLPEREAALAGTILLDQLKTYQNKEKVHLMNLRSTYHAIASIANKLPPEQVTAITQLLIELAQKPNYDFFMANFLSDMFDNLSKQLSSPEQINTYTNQILTALWTSTKQNQVRILLLALSHLKELNDTQLQSLAHLLMHPLITDKLESMNPKIAEFEAVNPFFSIMVQRLPLKVRTIKYSSRFKITSIALKILGNHAGDQFDNIQSYVDWSIKTKSNFNFFTTEAVAFSYRQNH